MEKISEAARIAKNKYLQQWRKKNPKKVKNYEVSYWERKAANNPDNVTVTDIVTDNVTVTDNIIKRNTDKSNVCIECNKPFQAKRSDSKFCSQACKQKHYRKTL